MGCWREITVKRLWEGQVVRLVRVTVSDYWSTVEESEAMNHEVNLMLMTDEDKKPFAFDKDLRNWC